MSCLGLGSIILMVAYGLSTDDLEVLTTLLLSGRMPFNFMHDHWQRAVQHYFDGKPLIEVFTVQSFLDMMDLLPQGRQSVLLIDKTGNKLTDRAVTSLRFEGGKGVTLPVEAAPDRQICYEDFHPRGGWRSLGCA